MKKELVVKSNKLINQSYKLTANEQKILYLLITKINKEDEDFKPYTLKISDFVELSGLEGRDKFGVEKGLPKITRDLLKKGFSVIDEKGNLLQVNWLSSAYHRKKDGLIELEFSPRLKPYLLQLKEKFTMFSLASVIKLKSVYSMRIYELLKQYEKFGERTLSIDELKTILSLHELKAYVLYGNIKLKILDVAKVELKELCDVYFEYVEIKEGRKVIRLKFIIYSSCITKNKEIENVVDIDANAFITKFKKKYNATLDKTIVDKLLKEKGLIQLENSMDEYDFYTQNRFIKNIAGDFYTFITRGYEKNISHDKSSIHNFDERKYTEEECEKHYVNVLE